MGHHENTVVRKFGKPSGGTLAPAACVNQVAHTRRLTGEKTGTHPASLRQGYYTDVRVNSDDGRSCSGPSPTLPSTLCSETAFPSSLVHWRSLNLGQWEVLAEAGGWEEGEARASPMFCSGGPSVSGHSHHLPTPPWSRAPPSVAPSSLADLPRPHSTHLMFQPLQLPVKLPQ